MVYLSTGHITTTMSTVAAGTGEISPEQSPNGSADHLQRVGLPVELYERIVRFVPDEHIVPLLSTSRAFFHLVGPRIYHSLELHMNGGGGLLGYIDWQAQEHKDAWAKMHVSGPSDPPPPPFDFTAVPHTTLPYLLNLTRHVIVETHDPFDCDGHPSISLPNLVSMRIMDAYCHDLCVSQGELGHFVSCPAIARFRPSHMILGSAATGLMADFNGFWAEEYKFPPPWVKRLTFYIGDLNEAAEKSVLRHMGATLERLTLIFEPGWRSWSRICRAVFRSHSWEDVWEDHPPASFFQDLAAICDSDAQRVEIVGMETISEKWLKKGGWEGTRAELEEIAKEHLISRIGSSSDDREGIVRRKRARVTFMTRKEWDASEGMEEGQWRR